VLDRAIAARVLERTNGTISFTHPLLASVVYHGVRADERRRAHGQLAQIVRDPLDRARHLALSTETPDVETARTLEEAAALASSRGAAIAAAELAEHALRLTPPDAYADRHRRAIAAARAQQSAGEWTRARSVVADLVAWTPRGHLRAEALVLLAELEGERRSIPLLEQALAEASSRPALQSGHPLQIGVGELQAGVPPCSASARARRRGRRRQAAAPRPRDASHPQLVRR
jgi:hypothetical protein